jgi:luciferase family oxidoreductase group 1
MDSSQGTRFSVLDLAPVKLGGTIGESFQNTVNLAQHAEKLGYTRFWLAEHHNMVGIASAATAVLIGLVAGKTTSIRVGSGGVMLPNHAPILIAEQFGTLETLYPGRIDLGIGRAPGTDPLTIRALRRDPRAADDFPEQLRELLALLGPAAANQAVRAVPGEGTNVPVTLLGSSTFSAQLAAATGLPFAFAAHFAPHDLHDAIRLYRTRFQPSQWLEEPYVIVGVPVVAAESDGEAQRLATTMIQRFLQLIRGDNLLLRPPIDSMDGLWLPNERLMAQSRMGEAIIGSPDTVRLGLEALLERTATDEIIISTELYDQQDRLRSYQIVAELMSAMNRRERAGRRVAS